MFKLCVRSVLPLSLMLSKDFSLEGVSREKLTYCYQDILAHNGSKLSKLMPLDVKTAVLSVILEFSWD